MVFNDYMEDALAIGDVCSEKGIGSSDILLFNYIHGRYFPNGLGYFIGNDHGEFDSLLSEIGLEKDDTLYNAAMLLNSEPQDYKEKMVDDVLVSIHDHIHDRKMVDLKHNFSRIRLFVDSAFREEKMNEYNDILRELIERDR
ncbi:MAG: hypothetical protein JW789_03165 [Candidatus Aenigmarchaeota archaeon]|nr:hypothetical protein [Candidatus Aenigmarchaeota archaeon]